MSRRKIATPCQPSIDRSHIVEDTVRSGEYVRVLGDFGVSLAGLYRIRCHALNTQTGTEWLELTDLRTRAFHAYRPEKTRPATKAEIRRVGLTVPATTTETSSE